MVLKWKKSSVKCPLMLSVSGGLECIRGKVLYFGCNSLSVLSETGNHRKKWYPKIILATVQYNCEKENQIIALSKSYNLLINLL